MSGLSNREVINVDDGKRLGTISDLEVDLTAGRVTAIVVPGPGRFLGVFGGGKDYVIPWENILKFGEDVILVRTGSAPRRNDRG